MHCAMQLSGFNSVLNNLGCNKMLQGVTRTKLVPLTPILEAYLLVGQKL